MSNDYDAIVVGARCAGAPTAMLLARKGYRVLVVDRASFPSDSVSTLVIHAPGVAALQRWGVLDQVIASGCPAIDRYRLDFGPLVIAGTPRPHEGISRAYAPRRRVLDQILVEAAAQAGAEVRERFTVEDMVVEDGTVVGIRGHSGDGTSVVERARVVIGADGYNSLVARAVGAVKYNEKPVLENVFYTFWSDLGAEGFDNMLRGDRGLAAVPTNDELTLLLVSCPYRQASAFKRDVEANYLDALDREPVLAERVRNATRQDRFYFGGVPNFFRTPFGPGWALVGDAGYCKDPITAQGISDAFGSAELCTTALDQTFSARRSFNDAIGDYQQARDNQAMAIYEFTTQMATLEAPTPEMQQLLEAAQENQVAMDQFVSVMAGTVSPVEFLDPHNIRRIMRTALLRRASRRRDRTTASERVPD